MINLYVIGCGGIGGYVIEELPMAIASLSLDVIESSRQDISEYLSQAGNIAIPSVVDRIVLVDGDIFEPRNALRQGMGAGSKLVQRQKALSNSMLMHSFLQNVRVVGYNAYVNPENVAEIIPLNPEPNPDNFRATDKMSIISDKRDYTVIMLGVDNLKTRYEVSKYAETFPNVLVLNGGNSKTSGHVTVYERHNAVDLDPKIYDVFPNIKPDADKRPDEAACTLVAPKHDQIANTNRFIADIMIALFNKWVRKGLGTGNQRRNEVTIDTENLAMMSLSHPKAEKPW